MFLELFVECSYDIICFLMKVLKMLIENDLGILYTTNELNIFWGYYSQKVLRKSLEGLDNGDKINFSELFNNVL